MAKFVQPELFTRFNPPPDVTLKCEDASLTQQEFADETDLNKIMERYAAGVGELPVTHKKPLYGDFSKYVDYGVSFQLIQEADEKFNSLPSKVRERFRNDPMELIAFIMDDGNRAEAEALGLLTSKKQASEASIGGGIAAVADENPPVSGETRSENGAA